MQSKYALRCLPLDPHIAVWGLITTASQIRNVKVVAWKTNTNLKLVKSFKELRFLFSWYSAKNVQKVMYHFWKNYYFAWVRNVPGKLLVFQDSIQNCTTLSGHQLSKDCGLSCCTSCSVQDGLSITGGNTAGPQRTVSIRDLFSKFEINRSWTISVMQYL